jgi:hypothetical protein
VLLLWLLMRRLALGLPTVLQLNHHPPLLFHEHGVCRFARPMDRLGSNVSSADKIWALVDSNRYAAGPATVLQSEHFFVVEAVPFSPPYLQWMDDRTACCFFMKQWSFSEVLQAYVEIYPNCPQHSSILQSHVPWVRPPHGTSTLVFAS